MGRGLRAPGGLSLRVDFSREPGPGTLRDQPDVTLCLVPIEKLLLNGGSDFMKILENFLLPAPVPLMLTLDNVSTN